MAIDLHPAAPEHFAIIKQHIADFALDDRELEVKQFTVALLDGKLAGFGRIRHHADCDEYCSLGVVPRFRSLGVAELITGSIIQRAVQPLYLVCVIPQYFEPLGFAAVEHYPCAIQDKLDYCIGDLAVPEPYVVMRYTRKPDIGPSGKHI